MFALPKNSILKLSLGCTLFVVAVMLGVIFLVGAPAADAAVCTFTAGPPTPPGWTNAVNWSSCGGTYPGANAGDTAQIGCLSTASVSAVVPNGVVLSMACTSSTVNVTTGGALQLEASSQMGSGGNTLTVTGGNLILNNVGNITGIGSYAFTMSSGLLQTNGTFTEPYTFGMSGGTLTNSGTITFPPGGILNLSGGNFVNNGTLDIQSNISAGPVGTFNWSGGTLNGTGVTQVAAGGTPAILNVSAPVTMNGGGTLNSTTSNFTLGASIATTSGTPKIINVGTMNQTALTATIGPEFDNQGTANLPVSVGTLSLNGGGIHSGTFAMGTGGTLNFNGTHLFNAGSNFTGTGNVQIAGGAFQANTGLTIPGNLTNNGSLTFGGSPQTLSVTGSYQQNAAGSFTVRLNGPGGGQFDQMIPNGATLNGTLNASLGYAPADNTPWNIIASSAGPISGDFTTFNLPNYANGAVKENPSPPTGLLVTLVATPLADLAVIKTGPVSVLNGQNASFTVKVTNGGPSAAGITFYTDTFTGGTFVSATPTAGVCVGTGPITCNFPGIANGGTVFITVVLQATAVGTLSNTVTRLSSTPADPNPANDSATANVTVNPAVDLTGTITPSTNPVTAGQPESWAVNVTNNGPDSASTVSVNLSIPTGTILSAAGGGFTCTNTATTANCTIATLAVGTQTITVSSTAPNQGGVWTMNGVVGSATTDTVPGNNSFSGTATVTASADMQITKTLTSTVVAGGPVTYSISIKNAGPSDALNVQVTDPTPAGMTFSSNAGACTSAFPCNLGTMTSGQVLTINSTYTLASNASGSVTNVATVTSTTPDPTPGNNSATSGPSAISQKADLSVTKSGPATTTGGSNITYNISVTNIGPSDASNVSLGDPTPAGLTFVSATGGCASFAPSPCIVGTMTSGQTKNFTATYTVATTPPNPIVNTASVSTTTPDPVSGNNSASATTTTAVTCPSGAPTNLLPANSATGVPLSGTLSWSNVGAGSYKVFFGKAGTGCQTLIANVGQTSLPYGGLDPGTVYEWRVEATTNGCTTFTSSCQTFTTFSSCPTTPPTLTSPVGGTVTGSATFTWTSVPGAVDYKLFVNGNLITTTMSTSFGPVAVSNGPVSWFVVAEFQGGCSLQSQTATFNGCNTADPPLPSIVANAVSGQGYDLTFTLAPGTTQAEVQESTDPGFGSGVTTTQTTTSNSVHFQHSVNTPTAFYYRVRALIPCANGFTAFSVTVRIVLAPIVAPTNPNISAPAGNSGLVQIPLHIPGFPGQSFPFTATLDNKPWLRSVTPSMGVLPPEGLDFIVTADITGLPNGTFTGTVILLVTTSAIGGNIHELGVTPVGAPVSVSLVTPVTPKASGTPPANALIIPSVGHLDGISSHWQSDIRVANTSQQSVKYQLTFTPDDAAKGVKQTFIDVDAGATTALDDMIKTWYGVGSLGETANGVLEIRPANNPGKGGPANDDVSVSLTTVASSRAYNVTSQGTLGQFIPALPFSGFVGRALDSAHAATVLGLQQIAQNNDFRTNLGVVEASGQPVSVLVSAFDSNGSKLLDFPLDLKGGQQVQLNSFLAQNKISLADGRFEVKVTSGEGKVTAYASVVDNKSGDPLLVSGVPLGQNAFDHFVLPGVADLNTGAAAWRTDMRLFNPTATPQFVTLSFYAQNSTSAPQITSMTINPGEIKKLDNTLASIFGLTNIGGAMHVTTNAASPLVVTGRTFNQTSAGTFGQFIPAVTSADAVGKSDRALQILQAEDSVRYRTNLGITEVTGKPATVEVQVILPDSKIVPSTQIPIAANGFIQVPVIQSLGLSNIYNARISLRVVDGDGKISAYGSVIDQITQDPTYIPAQK